MFACTINNTTPTLTVRAHHLYKSAKVEPTKLEAISILTPALTKEILNCQLSLRTPETLRTETTETTETTTAQILLLNQTLHRIQILLRTPTTN
jgi:hypothetical protein